MAGLVVGRATRTFLSVSGQFLKDFCLVLFVYAKWVVLGQFVGARTKNPSTCGLLAGVDVC